MIRATLALFPMPGRIALRRALLMVGLVAAGACASSQRNKAPLSYEAQFDRIWSEYDRVYPAFSYKNVSQSDWNDLRAKYRPRAASARTQDEFIAVVRQMLEPLRDVHSWFVDPKGTIVPTYVPYALENFDRTRWTRTLRNASYIPHGSAWGEGVVGGFGYLFIDTWAVNRIDTVALDAALLRMRDTPGLIIDVRTNAGGSDVSSLAFASRFAQAAHVVSYVQVRNGDKHDDLGPQQARSIAPRGSWQYTKPVIVLSGRGGFSANESFVAAMRTLPQVTVVGDTTGGASGNPTLIPLGNGWSFSVPRWIEYGPDKQPIEWKGVAPNVAISWTPAQYTSQGDPLIDTAVGMLGEINGMFKVVAPPDKIRH
jgi:carboxyl-terminal processing protease